MAAKLKKVFVFVNIVVGLWFFLFGVFILLMPFPKSNVPADVQAIIVFTGDIGRVGYGLDLLSVTKDIPVLISGVHPRVSLADIVSDKNLMNSPKLSRLFLEHSAQTTRQNVLITKEWLAKRGINKIGLVTSNYHMLRCRILFARLSSDVEVVTLPVNMPTSWMFLVREYTKLWVLPWLK